jgi:glutathione S-transferase
VILIGQYDSPFVRRVAIALGIYEIDFEHRPWSTFGDAEEVARYNPLRRVPTLVLDDGEVLIESAAILDYLDEIAPPHNQLIAEGGLERRAALKICALGMGLADKAVSLLYERVLRQERSELWVARCNGQIAGVLGTLEEERARRPSAFWFGERINHADIAVACAVRFVREAHPGAFEESRLPALAAHAARCEALNEFRAFVQPLIPPS